MGLFEPAWKSRDQEKAFAYIRSIKNTDMLCEIYQEARNDDHYYEVMLHAAMRLADNSLESQLHPRTLRALALFMYDKNSGDSYKRVVAAITDQDVLAEIAQRASYDQVALTALHRIDDQMLLAEVAKIGKHPSVALEALTRITDHVLVLDISENARNKQIAAAAEKKALDGAVSCDDQKMIDNIALSTAARDVFIKAIDKLQDATLKEQVAKAFLEKNRDKLFDPLFETVLSYITDQDYLNQIVSDKNEEYDEQLRAAAVKRIVNAAQLEQIILNEQEDYYVRQSALEALRHPTKLYSIVLKWLNGSHYVKLFDDALAKFSSRDLRTLTSIVMDDHVWEFRVSAFKRILEFDDVSVQEKRRLFDAFMGSINSTGKVQRLIGLIPVDLRAELGLQVT